MYNSYTLQSSAEPGVNTGEDNDPELENLKAEVSEENTAGQSKCDKKTDEVTGQSEASHILTIQSVYVTTVLFYSLFSKVINLSEEYLGKVSLWV